MQTLQNYRSYWALILNRSSFYQAGARCLHLASFIIVYAVLILWSPKSHGQNGHLPAFLLGICPTENLVAVIRLGQVPQNAGEKRDTVLVSCLEKARKLGDPVGFGQLCGPESKLEGMWLIGFIPKHLEMRPHHSLE